MNPWATPPISNTPNARPSMRLSAQADPQFSSHLDARFDVRVPTPISSWDFLTRSIKIWDAFEAELRKKGDSLEKELDKLQGEQSIPGCIPPTAEIEAYEHKLQVTHDDTLDCIMRKFDLEVLDEGSRRRCAKGTFQGTAKSRFNIIERQMTAIWKLEAQIEHFKVQKSVVDASKGTAAETFFESLFTPKRQVGEEEEAKEEAEEEAEEHRIDHGTHEAVRAWLLNPRNEIGKDGIGTTVQRTSPAN